VNLWLDFEKLKSHLSLCCIGDPLNAQIILFDTEYTAWEGSKARQWSEPWEQREIIQIAAVRIALDEQLTERACFDCLVKPKHNPILSAYITALTGIQQAAVDTRGIGFPAAFAAFYAFCDQGRLPLFCYGDAPAVLQENFVLNQMDSAASSGVEAPLAVPAAFPAGINDIRVMFAQAGIDTRQYTSGTVYRAVGAEFDQAAHNALNDVRSLAVTIRQLAKLGQMDKNWVEAVMPRGKSL
jgi:inhibitor of KinA sporulation pathway (predicted exonuclease)